MCLNVLHGSKLDVVYIIIYIHKLIYTCFYAATDKARSGITHFKGLTCRIKNYPP